MLAAAIVGICGAIASAVICAPPTVTEKKPVESLLPADALIYFGWDGTERHKEAWERTAAYESLEKSGLLPTLSKLILSFVGGETKEDAAAAAAFVGRFARTGISVAVTFPADFDEPRILVVLPDAATLEPILRPTLIKIAGPADAVEVKTVRGRAVSQIQGRSDEKPEFGWWVEGGNLLIGFGGDVVESTIKVAEVKSPSMAASDGWKKLRATSGGFDPVFGGWIDVGGLKRRFAQTVAIDAGEVTVEKLLKSLGLEKMGQIIWRTGLHERELVSEITVEAPAPRTGLLALFDQRPLSLKQLPPLPEKSTGFMLFRLDWSTTYDNLLKTMKDFGVLIDPTAPAFLDTTLAEASKILGFDLKRDLFDALGSVVCVYQDVSALPAPVSLGLAIEVKDAEKVGKSVKALIGTLESQFPDLPAISREKKYGRQTYSIDLGKMAPIQPSLCVDKDWLFFGLTAKAVESCLLRVDGKLPRWKPKADEQKMLGGAPKEFVALSLSDPRPIYGSLVSLAPAWVPFIEQSFQLTGSDGSTGGSAKRTALLLEMPVAETVTRPLFPNISTWTSDAAGFHFRARESVPSLISPATAGCTMALLLPGLGALCEQSRRQQSEGHLTQILSACQNYQQANSSLPQGTHGKKELAPEKRFGWLADLLPHLGQEAMYDQLDFAKSWDDKANQAHVTTPVAVFLNPGVSIEKTGDTVTHYVGLAGLGVEAPTLALPSKKAGCFAYDRVTRISDITDGTSTTAMVSEASKDYGSWAAGGRPTIRALTKKPYFNGPDGIGGPFRGGCHVGFADGSVRFLSTKIDPKVMEALVTIQGGETVTPESLQAK
jgi:hypothetical protein